MHMAVYTYGSKLETQSARFSGPGDFFTYLIFVATTIMVSLERTYLLLLRLSVFLFSLFFASFLYPFLYKY